MPYRKLVILLLLLPLISVTLAEDKTHWRYEGEEGPDHWGDLDEAWHACSEGSAQSPINLSDAVTLDLSDISFNYGEAPLKIFNNGHTIEVEIDPGYSIRYNEIDYELTQFHFHNPSEHLIDGEAGAMEAHFVHASQDGNLAVVGVILKEGEASEDYAPIFDNLPSEESAAPEESDLSIDLTKLLPAQKTFWTYGGSLTTPPCSEIVRWLVLTEPITLSAEQIEAFTAIHSGNARPVLPLNERDLFQDEG